MSPAELPTGAPPASPANHIGERVLQALESFVKLGDDLRRDIAEIKTEVVKLGEGQEKLRTEVTDIIIANGEIKSSLAYIKDSFDRNNSDIKSSIERKQHQD